MQATSHAPHKWAADDRAAAKPAPDIDFDEAERHVRLLDPEEDSFLFTAHDDDKERVKLAKRAAAEARAAGLPAPPPPFKLRRGSIREPQTRAWMREQHAAGWALSVTVQSVNGNRRTLENISSLRAVWAELDDGLPTDPWPLEPSFVNQTSDGRFHAYWLVDQEAPLSREQFGRIMMCMIERYGSDPDAKDLTRTLRLAGTLNQKPGRAPQRVKIIQQTGARYIADKLVAAFPAPPRPTPTQTAVPRPYLNGGTPPGLERFVEA